MKEVTVKVSSEAHEVAEAISGLVLSTKKALADGFQAGADMPAVLVENMAKLLKAIEGVEKLPAEAKEDVGAFVSAFTVETAKIVSELLKKPVA